MSTTRGMPPTGRQARSGVTFTWLRQAGFLVEGRTAAVLFDPFLTDLPGMLVPPARRPEEVSWVDRGPGQPRACGPPGRSGVRRVSRPHRTCPGSSCPGRCWPMAIEAGVPGEPADRRAAG